MIDRSFAPVIVLFPFYRSVVSLRAGSVKVRETDVPSVAVNGSRASGIPRERFPRRGLPEAASLAIRLGIEAATVGHRLPPSRADLPARPIVMGIVGFRAFCEYTEPGRSRRDTVNSFGRVYTSETGDSEGREWQSE